MRATIKQFKNLIVLVLCILFLFTIVFNLHISQCPLRIVSTR